MAGDGYSLERASLEHQAVERHRRVLQTQTRLWLWAVPVAMLAIGLGACGQADPPAPPVAASSSMAVGQTFPTSSPTTAPIEQADSAFHASFDVTSVRGYIYGYSIDLDSLVLTTELADPGFINANIEVHGTATIHNGLDDRPAPFPGISIELYLAREEACARYPADTPAVLATVPLEDASSIDGDFVCHFFDISMTLTNPTEAYEDIPPGGSNTLIMYGLNPMSHLPEGFQAELNAVTTSTPDYIVVTGAIAVIGGSTCGGSTGTNGVVAVLATATDGSPLEPDTYARDRAPPACSFNSTHNWQNDALLRFGQ